MESRSLCIPLCIAFSVRSVRNHMCVPISKMETKHTVDMCKRTQDKTDGANHEDSHTSFFAQRQGTSYSPQFRECPRNALDYSPMSTEGTPEAVRMRTYSFPNKDGEKTNSKHTSDSRRKEATEATRSRGGGGARRRDNKITRRNTASRLPHLKMSAENYTTSPSSRRYSSAVSSSSSSRGLKEMEKEFQSEECHDEAVFNSLKRYSLTGGRNSSKELDPAAVMNLKSVIAGHSRRSSTSASPGKPLSEDERRGSLFSAVSINSSRSSEPSPANNNKESFHRRSSAVSMDRGDAVSSRVVASQTPTRLNCGGEGRSRVSPLATMLDTQEQIRRNSLGYFTDFIDFARRNGLNPETTVFADCPESGDAPHPVIDIDFEFDTPRHVEPHHTLGEPFVLTGARPRQTSTRLPAGRNVLSSTLEEDDEHELDSGGASRSSLLVDPYSESDDGDRTLEPESEESTDNGNDLLTLSEFLEDS